MWQDVILIVTSVFQLYVKVVWSLQMVWMCERVVLYQQYATVYSLIVYIVIFRYFAFHVELPYKHGFLLAVHLKSVSILKVLSIWIPSFQYCFFQGKKKNISPFQSSSISSPPQITPVMIQKVYEQQSPLQNYQLITNILGYVFNAQDFLKIVMIS